MKYRGKLSAYYRKILNLFYVHLKSRRYSSSTVTTYSFAIADFLSTLGDKSLENINNSDVDRYLREVFVPKGYSVSSQRQFVSALKQFVAFYPQCQIDAPALERPRRDKKLPLVLSKVEVIDLIRCTRNLKHRAVMAMIYSSGLRISELLNLELKDINIDRRQIHIRDSKGRKDRYVVLSEGFLPLLKNYLTTYRPSRYFVEGTNGGTYTASSVRKFIANSALRAGIRKKVTPHTLRHSYATHLLEDGVNLRHIQLLLGHSRPETTMVYTHVMKKDLLEIRSPLDSILIRLGQATEKGTQKFLLSENL